MSQFISIVEFAKLNNISRRRVATLIEQHRIPGAQKVGATWIIPSDAKREIGRRKAQS